jgi:hypothetical protein
MALRVERLAGLGSDAAAADLAAGWYERRWQWLTVCLAALAEQTLREPTAEAQQELLARIDEHPTPLVLGLGYQAELDKLRTQFCPSDDSGVVP